MQGGRRYGGGLVEVERRAVWGGGVGVYNLDETHSKWKILVAGGVWGATLAMCGGELASVGGMKDGGGSKEVKVRRGGRWTSMSSMLVGCGRSCALSISGGGLLVMGGAGNLDRDINDVQVFDGETWHFGPPLPERCAAMSAVVHGNQVFMMGGAGMKRAVWSANITDLVSH